MKTLKFGLLFFFVAAVPGCRAATEERISHMLRSTLDGGPLPAEKVFYDTINDDYVRQLSPESVKAILPLARTMLQDSRPEARKYGLVCFLTITALRFADSEQLLEPYISDLMRVADDRASTLRPMAIFVLGNTWPKVSPITLAYMAAHLADKENTAAEASGIAWILLRTGSDPLIHDVIAFARKENRQEVSEPILRGLHQFPTKNAEALAFIGENFDSRDEWLRRRAIEAVQRLPLTERTPFLGHLHRLANDPKEPTVIRSLAAEALKK